MNSNKVVLAAFLGSLAIITYRDFKAPASNWPLGSVPPPYRYLWAGVAFGLCALISDMINPKIGGVIAGGLFMGLAFAVITKSSTGPGSSSTPANSSPVTSSQPVVSNAVSANTTIPTGTSAGGLTGLQR